MVSRLEITYEAVSLSPGTSIPSFTKARVLFYDFVFQYTHLPCLENIPIWLIDGLNSSNLEYFH